LFFLLATRGKARRIAFYLAGVLLISFVCIFATRTTDRSHLQPIFSSIMRLQYWQETISVIRAFPLTGIGIGNFNLVHSRYAHNSYLQLTAEAGIIALAAFVWLTLIALTGIVRRKDGDRNHRLLIAAAAVVFLAHNVVDFSFFLPETSLIWWVFLGL
jgi:O-antigen ligase